MRKFNLLVGSGLVVSIIALALVVSYLYVNKPRIAYVRSPELVEKFIGTLEARSEFRAKKTTMQANVDSLRADFEKSREHYFKVAPGLSGAKRQEYEVQLTQQQNQFVQYRDAIDQKIAEEDNRMMQEVLNQINSFMEEYAIREGYTMVFGTTASGSLLYGEKSLDITDHLIEELNKRYTGK